MLLLWMVYRSLLEYVGTYLAPSANVIGGPSKMTFGTSNLLVFFVAEGYTIIKGVLDSTRPGLHNGLRKKLKK